MVQSFHPKTLSVAKHCWATNMRFFLSSPFLLLTLFFGEIAIMIGGDEAENFLCGED